RHGPRARWMSETRNTSRSVPSGASRLLIELTFLALRPPTGGRARNPQHLAPLAQRPSGASGHPSSSCTFLAPWAPSAVGVRNLAPRATLTRGARPPRSNCRFSRGLAILAALRRTPSMTLLLNLLWAVFGGGLVIFIEYALAGLVLCATVVGIPFGL